MTTRHRAFRYLFLSALLAGQWLYAAHNHHDDTLDSEHHCQVCLHGVQLDAFLPPARLEPPVPKPQNSFITPAQTKHSTFHERFHDSRAPPHS
jgi:hypothetical protein